MNRETLANTVILAALAGIPVLAHLGGEPFVITLATRIAILGLAGVGLNLALGHGGLVSFGHAAFFGVGGYAMGVLASHAQAWTPLATWPVEIPGTNLMPVIWLTAILAAGLLSLVIAALSLRTRGVYFIMITLAFAQMAYYFAISWPAYGGEDGLSIYVRNRFPGLNTLDPIQFFAVCFTLLCLTLALMSRITGSRFGLLLQATRQNPARVEALGVQTYRIRLFAFVLSAMVTGLAGALYADLNRFVSPSMMSWQMSGELIVIVILGGVGRALGPVAGAGLYVLLENQLGGISDHWQIFLGAVLLWVVLFARGGVLGMLCDRRSADG